MGSGIRLSSELPDTGCGWKVSGFGGFGGWEMGFWEEWGWVQQGAKLLDQLKGNWIRCFTLCAACFSNAMAARVIFTKRQMTPLA